MAPLPHVSSSSSFAAGGGKMSPPHCLDMAVKALWVTTPLTATLSLVSVAVAMTTNEWLRSEEKMPIKDKNVTADNKFMSKFTVSGLWRLCCTEPGELNMTCSNINYFPEEEYEPDPNDSTMAIPYAVTRSAGFFFAAGLLLVAGEVCCLLGHCGRKRRIFTFVSGVIFIVSGLIVLIGLVIYISTFKSEVGGKLKPKSTFQPAMFTYRYGYSFLLVVVGFMASEVSGTFAIFLYIGWHRRHWMKKAQQQHHAHQQQYQQYQQQHHHHHHHQQQQQRSRSRGGSLVLRRRQQHQQQLLLSPRYGGATGNNLASHGRDTNSLGRLEYLMYPDRHTPPLHICLRHPPPPPPPAGTGGGGGGGGTGGGVGHLPPSSWGDADCVADGLTPPRPPMSLMLPCRSKSQHDLHYSDAPVHHHASTCLTQQQQQQAPHHRQQHLRQLHHQQHSARTPPTHQQQYIGRRCHPHDDDDDADTAGGDYYIPRDLTCNTVSTFADVASTPSCGGDTMSRNRDFSREFHRRDTFDTDDGNVVVDELMDDCCYRAAEQRHLHRRDSCRLHSSSSRESSFKKTTPV